MCFQWDRSLYDWSSGCSPAHFIIKDDGKEQSYQRNMKDTPWKKKKIDDVLYYGKNLEGECWAQIKTGLKIAATGLVFLPVVTIPLLIWLGAHEKIVLWSLQLQTECKLKYKITHQPAVMAPGNAPLSALPDHVIGEIFKNATLNPEEAKNYFGTLFFVSKNFVSDKETLRLDLINKGKLKIHEIPELNGEKDAILNYIRTHGARLTWIELGDHQWSDQDVEEIVKVCPHLKTFIYRGEGGVTLTGINEILKVTTLEVLVLAGCPLPPSLNTLKNLKELSLSSVKATLVPSWDQLTKLEKLSLSGFSNIPSLDPLTQLKDLSMICCLSVPSLDRLVELENLEIIQFGNLPLPSLDALVNLVDLSISGNTIPSLKQLGKLKKLQIDDTLLNITKIDLPSQAPLEELYLDCDNLKEFPKIDQPERLRSLSLYSQKDFSEDIKQFPHLRRLESSVFSSDLMNHLPNLEDLSVGGHSLSQLNNISLKQKQQLKKLHLHNSVGQLPLLNDFIRLEELSLNSIRKNSISLEKNIALKKLRVINGGPLKRIKHLSKLAQLTDLHLAGCPQLQVRKSSLNALQNLTDLYVYDCGTQDKKLISERLVRLQKARFVAK